MSTRARIIVKVKPEYRGLLKFTINTYDNNRNPKELDEDIKFMCNNSYVYSYINHDGYLAGVGDDIHNELKPDNYKNILLYVLQGDRTSFELPYYKCNETWKENKPKLSNEIPDDVMYDYFYLFTDEISGNWEWFYHQFHETEWKSLNDAFIKDDEENKKYNELIVEQI